MNIVSFFNRIPILRLLIVYLAGILFAMLTKASYPFFSILFFTFFSIYIVAFVMIKGLVKQYIMSPFALMLFFLLGIVMYGFKNNEKFDERLTENEQVFVATVIEPIKETAKSVKTFLQVKASVDSAGNELVLSTKMLAYFQQDSVSKHLMVGDKVVFRAKPEEIEGAKNPYAFDYKNYLAQKSVFYSVYIPADKFMPVGTDNWLIVYRKAAQVRNKLLQVYQKYGFSGQELAVISALTLGDKSMLDPDTKLAFSTSGAMHVLAVSGLHVGIVFAMFNYFLRRLGKTKRQRLIRALLQILMLWTFALLTGLSPSVSRAAMMFSFVAGGQYLKRNLTIYHSLVVSAFVLLLINPNNIHEIGFLLSYSAVLAIVSFQPLIFRYFYFKSKIIDNIWALTTVSVAAQIGTLPISFFYFHQFPVYFILTNVIVIPLATFILYTSVALFLFSWWDFAAQIIAYINLWLVKILNYSTAFIEQLPNSSIQNIRISIPEIILLYAFFVFLYFAWQYDKAKYMKWSLGFLVVFLMVKMSYRVNNAFAQSDFIVFDARQSTSILATEGNSATVYSDSSFYHNTQSQSFTFQNYLSEKEINELSWNILQPDTSISAINFLSIRQKKVAIIDSMEDLYFETPEKMDLDIVVITQNAGVDVFHVLERFNPKRVVIGASNKIWRTRKWIIECGREYIPCHVVAQNGAYVFSEDTVFTK